MRDGLLPAERPAGALVGRQHELAQVRSLFLAGERLLTLTGPPGVGKTRLALEAVSGLREKFEDGVFFVSLAPLAGASLVPAAIAGALGIADAGGGGGASATWTGASLAAAIDDRRLLLVLDNMEHLLPGAGARVVGGLAEGSAAGKGEEGGTSGVGEVGDMGAAALVASLLSTCPQLAVLVTSRAPLCLSMERELAVPPLAVPSDGDRAEVDVASSEAVHLFVERARRVRPEFSLGSHNAADVAAVCRGLDGLPLAIELAAARVRSLGPADIARQLDRRLVLLTGGPRDAPARQHTVRGAIDWSYRLLSADEARLFRRLAVFSGGFDLEAVASAAAPAGDGASGAPIEDLLQALAQHSLLTYDAGTGRLGMLALIRDFALERLQEAGETESARWRHARYYAGLASRAEPLLRSNAQTEWVRRLGLELGNVRAALTWLRECACEAPTDAERAEACFLGLQLSGGLWWFWHLRSHVFEGREWLSTFLDATQEDDRADYSEFGDFRATRARALFGAGFLAWSSGFWDWDARDRETSRRCQDESLAAFRAAGDRVGEGFAVWGRALAEDGGSKETQQALLAESLAIFREVGERWGIVKALEHLADRGPRTESRRRLDEALPVARDLGEPQCLITILRLLGIEATRERDGYAAREYLEESRAVLEESGLISPSSITEMSLGHLARFEGDLRRATDHYLRALRSGRQMGSRRYAGESLLGLAETTAGEGRFEHALRLLGAAAYAWRPTNQAGRDGPMWNDLSKFAMWAATRDAWLVRAREALGEERAGRLFREGTGAKLDTLLEATLKGADGARLAALEGRRESVRALPGPSVLSAREEEAAGLIAQGLSNREIAAALTITERTVMRHVEHILTKLALRSRTQIAVWYLERKQAATTPGSRPA